MTEEPSGNIVRVVVWAAIIVIVLGVLLSIAAQAQELPPITEQHCCKLWLPVTVWMCEDEVCAAGYTWGGGQMSEQLYWHFVPVDEFGVPRLARGDGREVRVGETLVVEGEPKLCKHGMHASRRLLDACRYCPEGRVALCLVRLGGIVEHDYDKSVATERTVVAMLDVDATKQVLGACARQSALSVAHLWDMPDVVRQFLETGDESLRDAASAFARAAAWAAAWAADAARAAASAAWAAAWAADAACAAWAADATWAAWAAAWATDAASAASAAQNERLEQMALEAMGVTR